MIQDKRPASQSDKQRIVRLFVQGESVSSIATNAKTARATIEQVLREAITGMATLLKESNGSH